MRNSRLMLSSVKGLFFNGIFALFINVVNVFLEKTENVVHHKVAIWLHCKEKGLSKLVRSTAIVGHFTKNLNKNAIIVRCLTVNTRDEHFARVEIKTHNTTMNFLPYDLKGKQVVLAHPTIQKHMLMDRKINRLVSIEVINMY